MYLDAGTWIALCLLALVCGAIWFWNDSLLARERMLESCARLCRDLRLQFLDETVTLARIRPGRSDAGWLQFTRLYLFEFSGTGQDRWQGRATLAGRRVISVQFENAEGVTIMGEGGRLLPQVPKLSHAEPSGDKPTLH